MKLSLGRVACLAAISTACDREPRPPAPAASATTIADAPASSSAASGVDASTSAAAPGTSADAAPPSVAIAFGRCAIDGKRAALGTLTVDGPARGSIRIDARDVSASLQPALDGSAARVHVVDPLIFEARASGRIPYRIARATTALGGVLRLVEQSRLEVVRGTAAGALEIDVSLGGETRATRVTLPCDAVVAGATRAAGAVPRSLAPAGARPYDVTGPLLLLSSAPGSGSELRVAVKLPRRVWVMSEQQASLRVWLGDGLGTVAEGWAPAGQLRAVVDAGLLGDVGTFGHASGSGFAPRPCGFVSRPGVYQGKARLRRNAWVHVARGGEAWARAARDLDVSIQHRAGDAWAELRRVPGIAELGACDGSLEHAWVSVQDVAYTAR